MFTGDPEGPVLSDRTSWPRLNDAGRGRGGSATCSAMTAKWRNLAKRPARRFRAAVGTDGLAEGAAGSTPVIHLGANFRKPRRPTAISSSKPISGCRCGSWTGWHGERGRR